MSYHSQIGQDRWVDSVIGPKSDGFFIELGACDGKYFSNTLYFEEKYGWNGICIEPNDNYIADLRKNRKCMISDGLVYSEANCIVDFAISQAASGVVDEYIGPFTNKSHTLKKTTTTLCDILSSYNAPKIIDYLSLDVEGQEYNILRTFPFDKYIFNCITVEHNAPHVGPQQQSLIRDVLTKNGYIFIKGNDDVNNWGHGPIDDFYIHSSCMTNIKDI